MTTYLLLSFTDDGRATLRRLRKCSELTYRVEPPHDGRSNLPCVVETQRRVKFETDGCSIDVVRLPEEAK